MVGELKPQPTFVLQPGMVSLWGIQHLPTHGWKFRLFRFAKAVLLSAVMFCSSINHRSSIYHPIVHQSFTQSPHPKTIKTRSLPQGPKAPRPLSPPSFASWLEKRSPRPSSRRRVRPVHPARPRHRPKHLCQWKLWKGQWPRRWELCRPFHVEIVLLSANRDTCSSPSETQTTAMERCCTGAKIPHHIPCRASLFASGSFAGFCIC